MAVVIRMKRTGRRNRPCYRISVADSSFPRDGRTLETLGVYDPVSSVADLRLKLDVDRARHWVQRGALPSDTVRSIFKREGVYEGMPAPARRKRTGRNAKTAAKAKRTEEKTARAERKQARYEERVKAKREAAKAAAAAAEAEGSEE